MVEKKKKKEKKKEKNFMQRAKEAVMNSDIFSTAGKVARDGSKRKKTGKYRGK